MLAPASALAWHLWLRARIGLITLAGYLLLLALVAHIAPVLLTPEGARVLFVALPMGLGILLILGAFTHADADIAAPESGYPTCLLVLPIPSWQLVFWPMLYGVVCATLTWLAFAILVFRPLGMDAPLWWPAATLAAYMVSLQALTWMPMGVPYLRVVTITVAMLLLLYGSLVASMSSVAPSTIVQTMLYTVVAAAAVAYLGVREARHGPGASNGPALALPKLSVSWPGDARPFNSPEEAQFWFEWKRNGWALPLMTLVLCIAMAIMVALYDTYGFFVLALPDLGGGVAGFRVYARLSIVFAFAPLYLLPLLGLVLGAGINKLDTRRRDHSLQPFLAARPLSGQQMLSAKLRRITRSTLISYAIALGFLCWALLVPGQLARDVGVAFPDASGATLSGEPLLFALARGLDAETGNWILLWLLALVVVTWKNQAQRISVDLSGREWIVRGFPLLMVFLGALYLTVPTAIPQETQALWPTVFAAAVLELLVAKLTGAALVLRCLALTGAASRASLVNGVLVWAGVLALLLGLLYSRSSEPHDLLIATGVIVLLLPAVRLGLAPLALEGSRHQ
ncbi:MAG TPA: hypothetical protein VGN26_05000 [Armatimonadota bacterium]|jgi:hypothetical protein